MCLISERRLGKSKLEISERYYTFYVDILHTACFQEFTYEFGQAVFNRLRSRSRKMLQNFVQGLKSINAEFGFDPVSDLPTFSLGLGDISRPEYTLDPHAVADVHVISQAVLSQCLDAGTETD